MYKKGVVYIWQNMPDENSCLNGVETTVTEGPLNLLNSHRIFWITDTQSPTVSEPCAMLAEKGDLREKYPPSGELSILELFKQPELQPA